MYLFLKESIRANDGTQLVGKNPKRVTIPVGRFKMERVPNPLGFKAPWLVIKGTKIGAAEVFFRQGGIRRNPAEVSIIGA